MTDAHGATERERRRFKVGVTIHPQQCTINELRDAWRRADALGVDSIWFWDHFFPLYGDPEGNQFECWSLLAAAAVDTRSEEHTSELQSRLHLVCRLLLEQKKPARPSA